MAYTAGPFDSAHLYLQWGGKLPGNEQWSCGLRLRQETGTALTNADIPAMLASAVAALTTFHNGGAAGISSNAKLSIVKLNPVGTDGKYLNQSTFQTVLADIPGGGSGSAIFPNQVTLAVSLTTGFSRGPAHRGRFYLPLPNIPLQADGRIAAGAADGVSGAVDTLVTALNAANPSFEVAVFSRKLGAPGNRRVTGNLVGRVYDTQRRRRRALIEDYA